MQLHTPEQGRPVQSTLGSVTVRKELRVVLKAPASVPDQRHECRGPANLDLSPAAIFLWQVLSSEPPFPRDETSSPLGL